MADNGTMQIVIKGKNLDVTERLRDYGDKKVRRLERFFERRSTLQAEVTFSQERELIVVEVTMWVDGLVLRGVAKTDDALASIDQAVDRMERQVRKFKTRIQRRLHNRRKLGEAQAALAPELDEPEPDEEGAPRIARTKRFPMKPMSPEEAIMQMELLGHDFFVFANAESEQVNVVYRRHDGDYGLIEPDA